MDSLALKTMSTMSTADLSRRRVYVRHPKKNDPDALKKVGKIHAFVFHPKKAKLLGCLIKRPDLAWMFRRGDVFVSTDGLEFIDGDIVFSETSGSYGREAEKRLSKEHGIGLDDCILWVGLPIMTENGDALGLIRDVEFDIATGNVTAIVAAQGATADTLLGARRIPARMIRGFRRGKGARLSDAPMSDSAEKEGEAFGAFVVSDEALGVDTVGGVAEKAGAATAVIGDKTKKTYRKVVAQAGPLKEKAVEQTAEIRRKAGEQARRASAAASDAAEKGAFVTGRQIARAAGMFSDFRDEFKRALDGEDDEDLQG